MISLNGDGVVTHKFFIKHSHSLDFDPTSLDNIIFLPKASKLIVQVGFSMALVHMEVAGNENGRSIVSSLLINPEMGMLLHAAEATLFRAATSLFGLEFVGIGETLIFGVGKTLLNQVLHELIVVTAGISIRHPFSDCWFISTNTLGFLDHNDVLDG